MKKLFFLLLLATSYLLLTTATAHASANPGKACPVGESRYRPGGDCEKEVPSFYFNFNNYPLTCQDIPLAKIDKKSVIPYPLGTTFKTKITSDIAGAELGGLGPNSQVINSYSQDALAQIYAFNGLFDKPASMENQPREAARTYWRLLSTKEQANAKAAYFNLVLTNPNINNTTLEFYNPIKSADDTITILDLANSLPACLTTLPVCDNFMKSYLDTNEAARSAYDALLPFNFDNIRGYQVLNNIVYKENLPFVQAIYDGLTNPNSGLLNTLSPSWINNTRKGTLYTNASNDGTIPTNSEAVLASFIANYAKNLNPNDCLIHDNSTYLPSPLTYPKNLNGDALLNQDVAIPISKVSQEFDNETHQVLYHHTGEKEGLPVAVLNNPKLHDLSLSLKGPQSLTAIFLPQAHYIPNRDLAAPVANLAADDPDVRVEGKTFEPGMARIGRTGGEVQTQLCELRNKWLIPGNLQKNNLDCVNPFQTLKNSVQGPGLSTAVVPTEANCDKTAALTGNRGNLLPETSLENIGFPSGADKNNVKNCYNDLVNQASGAGYDPAFVMAIWLEESAASWYSSYPDVADFGCAVATPRMDFKSQLSCFLSLKNAYSRHTNCIAGSSLTVEDFLLIFSEGFAGCRNSDGSLPEPDNKCFDSNNNPVSHYRLFCVNKQFPGRIKNYYQLVTGGRSLNFNSPL